MTWNWQGTIGQPVRIRSPPDMHPPRDLKATWDRMHVKARGDIVDPEYRQLRGNLRGPIADEFHRQHTIPDEARSLGQAHVMSSKRYLRY